MPHSIKNGALVFLGVLSPLFKFAFEDVLFRFVAGEWINSWFYWGEIRHE